MIFIHHMLTVKSLSILVSALEKSFLLKDNTVGTSSLFIGAEDTVEATRDCLIRIDPSTN